MAWGRLVFYPGGTEEQYRAVVDAIPDFDNVPGRTYYAAGPTEGGWMMLTVWESQEDFQRFAREVIAPAHEKAGANGWQSPPQATDFVPQHVVT
jgi:hypothetical protein